MTRDDLIAWETRCGFATQAEAAAALGVSLRTYQGWHLGRARAAVTDALLTRLCTHIESTRITQDA
jgi:hypothetical protein